MSGPCVYASQNLPISGASTSERRVYPLYLNFTMILGILVLWVYEVVVYTRSTFGAAEPSTPDQGFEIDPDVV